MTTNVRALDAVLRFPGVTLSREAFEAGLALHLDRFEPSRAGPAYYAQINLPEGSSWTGLVELIDRIGSLVQSYMQRGEIARPSVDAVLYVEDDKASASLLVPHTATLAIGRWGFDLEVSAYLAASD